MSDNKTDDIERPSGTEGEVFDLVDRKGPITLKDLMKHIGDFSRDEVVRCLKSLESDGYVVEKVVEFEYGGIEQTRDEWSVNTDSDRTTATGGNPDR